jgi:uncharacterized protein (DUF305 family)
MHHHMYRRLALMGVFSFVAMYILMYAMVDRVANVFMSYNQFYMAALMTSPMIAIELLLMGVMYGNKKLNATLIAISILALGLFWFAIRSQAAIDDTEFLRSMIPHHAGAILMCEEADITDPEIQTLCDDIIAGQQEEIDWMSSKLRALE